MKQIITLSLILILAIATTSLLVLNSITSNNTMTTPFYIGVTFCGNTTQEAKLLIDKVQNYTNLFVLQSGPISKNETAINEICDYAVNAGLNIIVYFGWFDPRSTWEILWLNTAKQQWGKQFLGVYYYDEPGGIQLDYDWAYLFDRIKELNPTLYQTYAPALEGENVSTSQLYELSAETYVEAIKADAGLNALKNRSITAFTSDYALYWWDYLSGFDVILAQFGWNHTTEQDIALIRGAANLQSKNWGVILTWKYMEWPYLASGDEIYNQMYMAYECGANYIVLFNYAEDMEVPYGTLQDEHFDALELFWKEVVQNQGVVHGGIKPDTALVLPSNYGWGMRHPEDRIWFWGPDADSPQIWKISRKLLLQYGLDLDIVYEDTAFPLAGNYSRIYHWNETI
jgi:hypothetical protein